MNTGGFLEFIVLKMISDQEYSLKEISHALNGFGFKTPMGSLYPLLSKFRRNALVQRSYKEMDIGPAQRSYCLTEKGHQRLIELRSDWKRLNALIASLGSRH